jgi:hypothetical protein
MFAMFMFSPASNSTQVISEADFSAPLGKEQGYAACRIKDRPLSFQSLNLCSMKFNVSAVHGSLSISGIEKFVPTILGWNQLQIGLPEIHTALSGLRHTVTHTVHALRHFVIFCPPQPQFSPFSKLRLKQLVV